MSSPVTVACITTVGDMAAAREMARALVERRLAACVQLSAIESVYRWHDAVQHEPEVRVLCKTTQDAWPALRAAIVALHPYELPAVFAVRLDDVHAPYATWVAEQTVPNAA